MNERILPGTWWNEECERNEKIVRAENTVETQQTKLN